jgi:hypothetical protein
VAGLARQALARFRQGLLKAGDILFTLEGGDAR